MKCDATKHLTLVDNLDGFPTGEEILQTASKESVYIIEEPWAVFVCYFI